MQWVSCFYSLDRNRFITHFLSRTAPGDYRPINRVVTIPAGRTQTYVEVHLEVDYDVENMESFEMVLSNPSEGARLSQNVSTINIIDVDSKYPLHNSLCILLGHSYTYWSSCSHARCAHNTMSCSQ